MTTMIQVDDKVVAEIEQLSHGLVEATTGAPSIRKSLILQHGINALRRTLNDKLMADIESLAGTKLGFKTDKKYSRQEIREAVIEALCRGAFWVGNEFNIIAGSCYLTKEYFERKLRELDGLTELRIVEGVPHMLGDKGALVEMHATWKWQGQPDEMHCVKDGNSDTRIVVKVNSGMGADAILGKAKRKLYARIWNRVTGSHWIEAEAEPEAMADVVDAEDVQAVEPQQKSLTNE